MIIIRKNEQTTRLNYIREINDSIANLGNNVFIYKKIRLTRYFS